MINEMERQSIHVKWTESVDTVDPQTSQWLNKGHHKLVTKELVTAVQGQTMNTSWISFLFFIFL